MITLTSVGGHLRSGERSNLLFVWAKTSIFSCPQTSELLAFGLELGLMPSAPLVLRPSDPDWITPPADSRSWDFLSSTTMWTNSYNYSPLTYLSISILSFLFLWRTLTNTSALNWRGTRQVLGCSNVLPESPHFPDGRILRAHFLWASQCTTGESRPSMG